MLKKLQLEAKRFGSPFPQFLVELHETHRCNAHRSKLQCTMRPEKTVGDYSPFKPGVQTGNTLKGCDIEKKNIHPYNG